ncbi:hypothetical protein KFZ56_06065 [Virgibacillus sp. NKC19-3]|uniref:hypothetical protein n=1 Tax=Virgibacillus saliphilus TaxID=2831674 RepID=UPI001C9B98EC|nr:hypothetical protein [Virgibacillus sp. NKC19-3]MBY7142649.1 hypothetical protein [Virgibacillus sp. NKC19-3]
MKQLLKFELLKIVQQKSIYVVGFLVLGLFLLTSIPNFENEEAYYEPYKGKVTEEKQALVEEQLASLPDMNRSDEQQAKNNVYQTFLNERSYAESVQDRIMMLDEKTDMANGEPALLAMEQSMLEQLELDTFTYHQAPNQTIDFVNTFGFIFAGALILVGLFSVYSNEYTTGVDNYIFSSKRGRKQISYAKFGASFIYTILVVCVWIGFDVVFHFIRFGNSGWESPIQYINKYLESPYDFTMIEYFGIQVGVHLIAALGFAALVLFVSANSKKPIISFLISGIIFGLPVAWRSILMQDSNWLIDISFTTGMRVDELFHTFSVYNIAGLLIIKPIFIMSIMIIIAAGFILATYQYVKRREVSV